MMLIKTPKKYCIAGGELTDDGGAFEIPFESITLFVIASWGGGWEHVSVSLKNRCPNWREMNHVKDLFWHEDVVVMQLHVAKKDHVNLHDYCLHMWRPLEADIPLPPKIFVG